MYEKMISKIQQRFDDLESRIETRFSGVTEVIRGYTRLIVAFVSGVTRIAFTLLKSVGSLIGETVLILMCCGIPIILSIALGMQSKSLWGILLVIVAVALAAVLIGVAIYGVKGKAASIQQEARDRPWRTRLITASALITAAILTAYLFYFQKHDPPYNPIVQVVYGIFERLFGI